MERLLLKGVLLDGRTRNILIEDKRFKDLDAPAEVTEAKVLDASGTAILPALYNTHTHAAMTLLRGFADDMPLMKWLQEYIWPFEDKLTPEDVRHGSEIAIKEMVQSGTVFFNDMYFDVEETIDAVDRAGMRAAIGITVMENHSKTVTEGKKEFIRHWQDPTGGRIRLVMAPHAIYTVGERKLRDCAEFAREHGMLLHIHLSETISEVEGCQREHGTTPVRYLDNIGFLGPDVIAAHCVHVDDEEAAILAERGVTISHNPCSNMKLSSGIFPYRRMMQAGCRLTLGTDGASSGNNLDLREAMKFAALLAKAGGDPELLPAEEIFRWATRSGAEAFGIDAGVIAEGKLADCLLIDLLDIRMQPCHHLVSNFVYSADSRCIRNVLCDGRVIL